MHVFTFLSNRKDPKISSIQRQRGCSWNLTHSTQFTIMTNLLVLFSLLLVGSSHAIPWNYVDHRNAQHLHGRNLAHERELQQFANCEDFQTLTNFVEAFEDGCTCNINDGDYFSLCSNCAITDELTGWTATYTNEQIFNNFDTAFGSFQGTSSTVTYTYTSGDFAGTTVSSFNTLGVDFQIESCGVTVDGRDFCVCEIPEGELCPPDEIGFQIQVVITTCADGESSSSCDQVDVDEIPEPDPSSVLYVLSGFGNELQETCFPPVPTAPPGPAEVVSTFAITLSSAVDAELLRVTLETYLLSEFLEAFPGSFAFLVLELADRRRSLQAGTTFTFVLTATFISGALSSAELSAAIQEELTDSEALAEAFSLNPELDGVTVTVEEPPAPQPTEAPVTAPTVAPVPAPTEPPVPTPTEAPVPTPTEAPIPAPTEAPVPAPIEPAPTDAPVPASTEAPVPPVPSPTEAPATEAPGPECQNIIETACVLDEFTSLCTLLHLAGLVEALKGDGTLTVFAPTNEAFDNLGQDAMIGLLKDLPLLTNVLLFHVVGASVASTDLVCDASVEMLTGEETLTTCDGDNFFQSGAANNPDNFPQIVAVDIETCQGFIHVVDEVLLPGSLAPDPTEAPVAEPPVDCVDIVDVACGNDDFSLLCDAVEIAGLVDALSEGPLTVFAPTNTAFLELGEDLLRAVLADIPTLTNILLFHAVPSIVAEDDLVCTQTLLMANGQESRTVCLGHDGADGVFQKGASNPRGDMPRIIATNIETCQGLIHAVDEVLLPGGIMVDDDEPPAEDCQSIAEIACGNDDFSTLCAAVIQADLAETLSGGSFTVFAPLNQAFARLGEETLNAVLADIHLLTDILLYHVVVGKVMANDLVCTELVEMANGQDTRTICLGYDGVDGIFQKGNGNSRSMMPHIIATDIVACNGVVHVVDEVIRP